MEEHIHYISSCEYCRISVCSVHFGYGFEDWHPLYICRLCGRCFLYCLHWFLFKRNLKQVCKVEDPEKYSQECDALLYSNPSPSECSESHIPTKPNTVFRPQFFPSSSGPMDTPPRIVEGASCGSPPHCLSFFLNIKCCWRRKWARTRERKSYTEP